MAARQPVRAAHARARGGRRRPARTGPAGVGRRQQRAVAAGGRRGAAPEDDGAGGQGRALLRHRAQSRRLDRCRRADRGQSPAPSVERPVEMDHRRHAVHRNAAEAVFVLAPRVLRESDIPRRAHLRCRLGLLLLPVHARERLVAVGEGDGRRRVCHHILAPCPRVLRTAEVAVPKQAAVAQRADQDRRRPALRHEMAVALA